MLYLVKKPKWIKSFYGNCTWDLPVPEKVVYLTFDDGPSPGDTEFVLDQLKHFNAKATFFCIGQNVVAHPELFKRISSEGHSIGNHTWQHKDGWRSRSKDYYEDIRQAREVIKSSLFRPPYGHITPFQVKKLVKQEHLKIIMWSITSGDFDLETSPEKCYKNISKNLYPGAIVLMHDSEQASRNLRFALPRVLEEFTEQGYSFHALDTEDIQEGRN